MLAAAVALTAIAAVVTAAVVLWPQAPAELAWQQIGTSLQGRPIEMASFGSGARRVLVIGGVHGGEHGTEAAGRYANYLFAHPEVVPPGSSIDVIRCLNPDGDAAQTRGNANGVDLNRNMPTENWRPTLSAADQSWTEFRCTGGTAPASEPETQALLAQLETGYAAAVSLHSQGGFLDPDGPGARALAQRMAAICGLRVDTVDYNAAITGSMGQHLPRAYGIPFVTVELNQPKIGTKMFLALLEAAS